MKYVLDAITTLWIIGAYFFLLVFSLFLFDSPYATQGGAWISFMLMALIINGIPLGWWTYRLVSGGWFATVNSRWIFAAIVAVIWSVAPFIFWNFI